MAKHDPKRAKALISKLNAWHEWFHRARDPEGLGVIAVTHPWESGRDNLPDWDKPGDRIDVRTHGANGNDRDIKGYPLDAQDPHASAAKSPTSPVRASTIRSTASPA